MSNPVIHDFIVLVFVFVKLIKSPGIKKIGIKNLHWLFNERMLKHKDFFSKNNSIIESYKFTSKVVNYFCNKYQR